MGGSSAKLWGLRFNAEAGLWEIYQTGVFPEPDFFSTNDSQVYAWSDTDKIGSLTFRPPSGSNNKFYRGRGAGRNDPAVIFPYDSTIKIVPVGGIVFDPLHDSGNNHLVYKFGDVLADGTEPGIEEEVRVHFAHSDFVTRANTAFHSSSDWEAGGLALIPEGVMRIAPFAGGEYQFVAARRYIKIAGGTPFGSAVYAERWNLLKSKRVISELNSEAFSEAHTPLAVEERMYFSAGTFHFVYATGLGYKHNLTWDFDLVSGQADPGFVHPGPGFNMPIRGTGDGFPQVQTSGGPTNIAALRVNIGGSLHEISSDFVGGRAVLFPAFTHPVRIGDDEYWFVNGASLVSGAVYTWKRFAFRNGTLVTSSTQSRASSFLGGSSYSWDNLSPVDIFIPIDGVRVPLAGGESEDWFCGVVVRQSFVDGNTQTTVLVPSAAYPAMFKADLSESRVYTDHPLEDLPGISQVPYTTEELHLKRRFFGKFKDKYFFVWHTMPTPRSFVTTHAVLAGDTTMEPVNMNDENNFPDFVGDAVHRQHHPMVTQ